MKIQIVALLIIATCKAAGELRFSCIASPGKEVEVKQIIDFTKKEVNGMVYVFDYSCVFSHVIMDDNIAFPQNDSHDSIAGANFTKHEECLVHTTSACKNELEWVEKNQDLIIKSNGFIILCKVKK